MKYLLSFLSLCIIGSFGLFVDSSSGIDSYDQSINVSVSKGESLTSICRKYLDNPKDCPLIVELNKIENPDKIYSDQALTIPAVLLKPTPVDGAVTFLKGDVQLQPHKSEQWIVLHLNDQVKQGSRITTGRESAVEITFEDGITFFVKSETTIGIVKSQKRGPFYMVRDIFLEVGRILTTIKNVTGQESRSRIRTPSASTAARGTVFRVAVDQEDSTRTEALQGVVGVEAMNQEVPLTAGQGTYVKKGAPPLAPRKLLPPPVPLQLEPLYRQLPLQLQFKPLEGAFAYRVTLATDRDGKDVVKEGVISPSDVFAIAALEDGTFFLQTLSIDEVQLEGPPSEPIELTIRATHPVPPVIQAPVNGAQYATQSIEFAWRKVADAVRYHLQLAENSDFTAPVEDYADITEVSYTVTASDPNTYYVRMRSIAADGYEGKWSDPLSFTIMPLPSLTVEDVEGDPKHVHMRWPNLGQGITYHLQMARDQSFGDILMDQKLSKPTMTLRKPESVGTYYVRTSAIDPQGNEGLFSAPQRFEVKGFPDGLVAILLMFSILFILWLAIRRP